MPTVARSAKVGRRIGHLLQFPVSKNCRQSTTSIGILKNTPTAVGAQVAPMAPMTNPKRTVYVLRSVSNRTRYYTGVTSDWRARLDAHNSGKCPHTAPGRPWIVDVVVEFTDERRAVTFERYLKSGSGVAFAMRHLR